MATKKEINQMVKRLQKVKGFKSQAETIEYAICQTLAHPNNTHILKEYNEELYKEVEEYA